MNELYHHGIKGMHWGVRRFQNPDGTLTDAGKRHKQTSDRQIRRDVKRQRNWNAKNVSQLSDDELNAQINRLQKERQLKQLTREAVNPGRKKVADLMDRYGGQAISAVVTAATAAYVTNAMAARSNKRLAEKGYPVNIKGWHIEDGKLVPNANNN